MEFDLDAYGHQRYCVGWGDIDEGVPEDRGDWLACADFDVQGDRVGYHVVVNSNSGGFIDTLERGELTIEEARKQLSCLMEYWYSVAREHLFADSKSSFTKEEIKANYQAIRRWKNDLSRALEVA